MARGADGRVDAAQVGAEVERAQGAMDDVRRIKSQLSNAQTCIKNAREVVDAMAATVRGHLAQIDSLLADADRGAADDAAP